MARTERNDVDYFPHTVNHGKKMFFIENKYGNDGYATWFKILEELGKASYHYLNLNDDMTIMFLSANCRVTVERLNEILEDLNKLGEFDSELFKERILFNDRFIESINDAYKKRNNDCINRNSLVDLLRLKGILNKPKSTPNRAKSILKGDGNTQSKVKDSKEEESKEEIVDLSEFDSVFIEFLEMRKSMNKKPTDYAVDLIRNKLKKLSNNNEDLQIKILQQSIQNNWLDVFELKANRVVINPSQPQRSRFVA